MLIQAIERLKNGESLSQTESHDATLALLFPETPIEQAAQYLTLLRNKGETTAEILGVFHALQSNMIAVPTPHQILDIVGTGGDGAATVNISTGAAILAASCGVYIAKHGGRAVTSLAGSADVLEALGINITMSPMEMAQCLDELKLTFCFAPHCHPALAQLREVRRKLNTPTILNMVCTLLNPARATHYVIGVFSPDLLPTFAKVLTAIGVGKSVVVHSEGLDEMGTSGVTQVIEIDDGQQRQYLIDPKEFGFKPYPRSALQGGDARRNAELLCEAFAGKTGAIADALILNAAMAVYIYGGAESLAAAVQQTRSALTSGAAANVLQRWQKFSEQTRK